MVEPMTKANQMSTARPEAYGGIACHLGQKLMEQIMRGRRVPDGERSLLSPFPARVGSDLGYWCPNHCGLVEALVFRSAAYLRGVLRYNRLW